MYGDVKLLQPMWAMYMLVRNDNIGEKDVVLVESWSLLVAASLVGLWVKMKRKGSQVTCGLISRSFSVGWKTPSR